MESMSVCHSIYTQVPERPMRRWVGLGVLDEEELESGRPRTGLYRVLLVLAGDTFSGRCTCSISPESNAAAA